MQVANAYDAVNAAIFLPSGGSRRVRQSLVNALEIRPGHRVLELGCGTGQVTARLLAAGADVVAVDALPSMLIGARRRAANLSHPLVFGHHNAPKTLVKNGCELSNRVYAVISGTSRSSLMFGIA